MDRSLVCGLHAVLTALREHPERIATVWVSADRGDRRIDRVLEAARAGGIEFKRVARVALDEMVPGLRHQGVVAHLRERAPQGGRDLGGFISALAGTPLLLVLDGVQDPHNLGACLRVADAAGAHAVITPRDRAAPLSAVARRAASGAAETVPLFRVTNLGRALDELKHAGVWLYGAAEDAPEEIYAADLAGPAAVVLGGEGAGLRRLTRERCDRLVRVPMAGKVESLNVSVAAGVILYEAARQRRRAVG